MELAPLLLARCSSCHAGFVPRPGPCPRCGSSELQPLGVPPHGFVLASTELLRPPEGWSAPHRLALVELNEGIRLLALVDGRLPVPGEPVAVVRVGDVFHASSTLSTEGGERGARAETNGA